MVLLQLCSSQLGLPVRPVASAARFHIRGVNPAVALAFRRKDPGNRADLVGAPPAGRSQLSSRCCAQQVEDDVDGQTGLPQADAEPIDNFNLLTSVSSPYNTITVLESPAGSASRFAGSRLLLLDYSGNVHSIYKPDTNWTGSYWDEFASLPAIIPEGPVAILGLGGGSSARLILELWPSLQLIGYEIDELLVGKAKMYLGLAELEVPTKQGGVLSIEIADALSPAATVDGGFAGIIVDLFVDGEVLPQLRKSETWKQLKTKLKPGGRIMVNCGGECVEKSDPKSDDVEGTWTWEDGGSAKDATLSALSSVFPGQVWWRKMDGEAADNHFALTGDLPDREQWASHLPEKLKKAVFSWKAL